MSSEEETEGGSLEAVEVDPPQHIQWMLRVSAPMGGFTTYIGPFDSLVETEPVRDRIDNAQAFPMFPPDVTREQVYNYPETMIPYLEAEQRREKDSE